MRMRRGYKRLHHTLVLVGDNNARITGADARIVGSFDKFPTDHCEECFSPEHGSHQMIRKSIAVWRGTGRDGKGDLTTDSGALSQTPYSYKTRFEDSKGTNPEELIAAAHAGCFTMAVAFQLQIAGKTPTELRTEAAVT